jgi:hypothetical protein
MSNQLETALMGCVEEALMRDEYWEENPHYQCEECGKKCKCRMDFCQCDEFSAKSYEPEGEQTIWGTICDECLRLDEEKDEEEEAIREEAIRQMMRSGLGFNRKDCLERIAWWHNEQDEDEEGEEEGKVCITCGEFNLWKKYSFQIDVKNALTWIMTDECADCYEEERIEKGLVPIM